jgi:hypothetical protein
MGNTEFPSQFTEKEIQKLYARFKQIDEDNSGDLDPDEIFNVPELNQNPLVKRVISIFDRNKDGKISFSEFLSGTLASTQAWPRFTAPTSSTSCGSHSRSTTSTRTGSSPTASCSRCSR